MKKSPKLMFASTLLVTIGLTSPLVTALTKVGCASLFGYVVCRTQKCNDSYNNWNRHVPAGTHCITSKTCLVIGVECKEL